MSSKADLKEPLGGPILSAMKTLAFQQKGLAALYEAIGNGLGSSFQSAIEAIDAISGRVIVTGVGKSRLPALVADATGGVATVLPVRPDWTDPAETMGYTDLSGRFRPGAVLRAASEAAEPLPTSPKPATQATLPESMTSVARRIASTSDSRQP